MRVKVLPWQSVLACFWWAVDGRGFGVEIILKQSDCVVIHWLLTHPIWLFSKQCFLNSIPYQKHSFTVCVCVCERERERGRENIMNLLETDKEDTRSPTVVKGLRITARKIPHAPLVELEEFCIDQHWQRSRLEQCSHHGWLIHTLEIKKSIP